MRVQAANNLQNYGIQQRIGISGNVSVAHPSKNDQRTRNEFEDGNPEHAKQHKSQGQQQSQQQSFD
jgi:hypothetical protein